MTAEEIRDLVLETMAGIAPEADLKQLDPDIGFRDQLDIDSMDFLNFIIAVHERTGVEIPEADYPKLATLAGVIAYLRARIG